MDLEDMDDPMEIEDPIPATPIIERRVLPPPPSTPSEQSESSHVSADPSIVILDDDEDDSALPLPSTDSNVTKAPSPKNSPEKSAPESAMPDSLPSTSLELAKIASNASLDLLPTKSRQVYDHAYDRFMKWTKEHNVLAYSENVVMTYFTHLSYTLNPAALWSQYSMLKAELNTKHNIQLGSYTNLLAFLKKKNLGYIPKNFKVLSKDEVDSFLRNASDEKYLAIKVILILGVAGACRCDELTKLTLQDVTDLGSAILVKISKTKTYKSRSFTILDNFYLGICRKYMDLRKGIELKRFLIKYQSGKCHKVVIGKQKIASVPQEVASFLKLPNPKMYTGHCLRRTSANLLVDNGGDMSVLKRHEGCRSTNVVEGHIEDSMANKEQTARKILAPLDYSNVNNNFETESLGKASSIRNDIEPNVISQDLDLKVLPVKEIINLVDKPKNSRCINTSCEGKSSKFIFAPDFCLSSFRVKKSSNNKEEICLDCYYKSVADNDKLATCLKEGKLLFNVDLPVINETLQIDDSDEEDNETGEMEYISDVNFKFISENIEDILMETIEQLDLKNHVEREREQLKQNAKKVEDDCEELTTKVKEIRNVLDKIQIDLYNQFRPEFRQLKGIMILDDYSLSQTLQIRPENNVPTVETSTMRRPQRMGQRPILPATARPNETSSSSNNSSGISSPLSEENKAVPHNLPPKDLPVTGILDKPESKLEQIYYIAKDNNLQGCWVKARLQQIIAANMIFRDKSYDTTHYRLVELKKQTERIVSGSYIAYFNSCKSLLPVGTRVLSQFQDNIARKQYPYYAGVVAEHPYSSNRYRYLIFFDIGYAQYVDHAGVNLIFEASKNVWEDMPEDSRPFIKKYLESQDRPMVKLSPNQTVRVEYVGKWWMCTVKAIDCSLVQVYFDQIDRWEWIYRGSTRLSPMFREELAATTRQTGLRTPRKLGGNESGTVVQYTRNDDFTQPPATESAAPGVARAVARKSTTKLNTVPQAAPKCVPFLPPVNQHDNTTTAGPTSKIMYFTPRDQQVTKREYKPHECGPACRVFLTHNFTKLRGHNPLSKPLLCGWARMTFKDRGRKQIVYKAPCGRMMRNISEIHYYLRVTESEMTVDLFDFNFMVRCLAEFSVECQPDPKDLSKGLEHVPIPVINGFNHEMLDFCNYSIKRVPMEGVDLNVDEEFLCGCDCDDDCVDKLKCACWKLTLGGLKYLGKDVDPISVGYIYRRLQEQVMTGIYECNSRCKCSSTCLNRVAQNPMSLKLQVFKTHNRGWGIRCLNDIPQGTFICIYAGTLHTEQTANEDGMQYGDEYFAELDYIETVEKYKEDYEEEVMDDPELEEKEKTPTPPPPEEPKPVKFSGTKKRNVYMEDNDFTPARPVATKTVNVEVDQGYRSRLRRRKEDDEKKEKVATKKEEGVKIKQEPSETNLKPSIKTVTESMDTVTISDDEDDGGREVLSFNPKAKDVDEGSSKYLSVRELFGPEEADNIYIMDAKNAGNIGRFLNHSCSPNVFVQNVFVDTHDVRFPWVAFFSSQFIRAGTELTWNYNYDIGSVPGRVLYCQCASLDCKGRLL